MRRGAQPGAGVAQRQARPGGEVAVARGGVGGQVPACKLDQGAVAVDGWRRVGEHEATPSIHHRDAAQGGQHEQVRGGLGLGADARGGDALGQLGARERSFARERVAHDGHRAVGVVGRHALLAQAAATGREAGGRGEGQ